VAAHVVWDRLCDRLRRPPSLSSVPGSLPILFFGDLLSAKVATVGINPSDQEYLGPDGQELQGDGRRFHTLSSLGATERASLSPEQAATAVRAMRDYFRPGKPTYSWFRPLGRVAQGLGVNYERVEVCHLDLVQEATHPTWSRLRRADPAGAEALRLADSPFLRWQLHAFPLHWVICNGRTPLDAVLAMTGGEITETGRMARIVWSVGVASLGGRQVGLAGWNLPLARPTGLGASGEEDLGQALASRLRRATVP
jgi:hypothetical protein